MEETKQINIKNRTYYFYNDQIDLKHFDVRLLKIDKKIITRLTFIILVMRLLKNGDYNNINSVNPLYLIINEMIGNFECNSVKGKNENKYLVLDEIDENEDVLNKYEEVWEGIRKEIKTINSGKKN